MLASNRSLMVSIRLCLAVLALCLAGQTVNAQPAPRKPDQFLKWSMAKHAALITYQAECDWAMQFGKLDEKDSRLPTKRTLWYQKPNVFKVVATQSETNFVQTSVSDGIDSADYSSGALVSFQRASAPRSIATTNSMFMEHPMFCGSLLYKFFGGGSKYSELVNAKKMRIEFGEDVTLDGSLCKTVKFWAQGLYGKTEVAIGVKDGMVYRIRYGSEPFMEFMNTDAGKLMLKNAIESPESQEAIKKV
ncbi:MAG: hypothetical protein NT023_11880 [Armatimonadetes bacterium]|nr:hypothetical protein [Armatimonadota bacterium]